MVISNGSNCPDCGSFLKYYDEVHRIVRTKGGNKYWIKIRRFKCNFCNKIHRELPDFIFPYKHYEADIIKGVLDGSITSEDYEYEDYPCDTTMKRWTKK